MQRRDSSLLEVHRPRLARPTARRPGHLGQCHRPVSLASPSPVACFLDARLAAPAAVRATCCRAAARPTGLWQTLCILRLSSARLSLACFVWGRNEVVCIRAGRYRRHPGHCAASALLALPPRFGRCSEFCRIYWACRVSLVLCRILLTLGAQACFARRRKATGWIWALGDITCLRALLRIFKWCGDGALGIGGCRVVPATSQARQCRMRTWQTGRKKNCS